MVPENNQDGNLLPRPVRESQSEMIEIVLPNDANPLGNLLGGRLMHFIDLAGALSCHRHSRSYVVTASIEHLDFLAPVHVGDVVSFLTLTESTGRSSVKVRVRVESERYSTGETVHVTEAHMTMVAVNAAGKSIPFNSPPTVESE